jgi:hypothetical protein
MVGVNRALWSGLGSCHGIVDALILGRFRVDAFEAGRLGPSLDFAAYSVQRRMISEALMPPKPNEFDSATSIFASIALLAT